MKASSSNRTVDANKLSFDEHRGNNKAQKEFQPVLFVCSGALILLVILNNKLSNIRSNMYSDDD